MTNSNHNGDGNPSGNLHDNAAARKNKWLIWAILALAAFAIIFMLRGCKRDADLVSTASPSAVSGVNQAGAPNGTAILLPSGTSGIGTYLTGSEALPRTFVFEKLNFDTNKSEIRTADRDEVNLLAAALMQSPNARIRIVGYADARGSASANLNIGKARADSVKDALVAAGISADRLETASGGEANPVDSNATAGGQAENRRTEVVVLQR